MSPIRDYPHQFTMKWDTGRKYGPGNHEIEATVRLQEPFDEHGLAEAQVDFNDPTRYIRGRFTLLVWDSDTERDIQKALMKRYDQCDYAPV